MSNVIPIVSSSPPPLDDDEGYKWDSDDDEYGNFTSAPSISATTIASDSSFEVNWSTSETSFSANDGFSKGSSQNSSSKIQCDKGDLSPQSDSNISENVQSGFCLQPEGGILNGCEDIKTAGKSENFADFDNAKLNDSSFEVNIENKLGLHQDVILCLLQDAGHGNSVGVTEEVSQDFAQYNDTSVRESDKKATAKLGLSRSSQEEVEPNADGAIKATDHSNRSLQNSSPDHCTEASIVDSVSSVSVQWKNNDSTYSSVSTVDSGVFSTDLSPSYVQSEGADLSLVKEKDDALASRSAVSHQGDAATSCCSTSAGDADSLAAPVRLFKDTASSDNTISSTDTPEVCAKSVSSICEHSDPLAGSNNTLSSSHQQNEIESIGTAAVPEKEYSAVVLSDNRECVTDPTGANGFQHPEHSTLPPKTEPSDHSDSSREGNTEATGPSDLAFFSEPPCLEHSGESLSESCAGDHRTKGSDNVEAAAGIVSSDESRSQVEGHLSVSRSSRESESTLGCGDDVQCGGDISVKCEDSDGAGLNLNLHSADVRHEVSEVQGHDQGSVSSESHSMSVKSTEDAAHAESSLQNTGSELGREAEERHENTEGCEENKNDKEFGDFSSFKDRKNSDSHEEVAPITFRTSICEAVEENEDDEDFTFVRERPPAFIDEGDDDSGEFGEFGTASKDVSDNDDFGEFDSAENIKPSSSPATNLGKSTKDGDDFRDTNGPKTAEDDWADFGAVAPSEESSSFSGLSANQTMLMENSEQSKAEKLHCAVLSCFPESPVPVSAQNRSQTSINKEDRHESFSQDSFCRDGSPKEDEGPLPLDTVVDLGLTKALEAKQQTWAVVQHPAKKDPKVRLWAHLKDLDSCNALSYGWSTSHCSKEVFSTLHIDTQNVLFTQKKQAVPFFASGLGILEPIRGGGGAASDGKKGRSSMSPPQSALLDTNRPDHLQNPLTQDIPPVDFDWSTSGLTNPLTVFKAENQDSARIPLQPLEEILKKTTPTAKFVTNEVLSPEAVRILEKMPDLSFMHSAVLMFPVKQ